MSNIPNADSDRDGLLDQDLARLLEPALAVEAPPLNDEQARWLTHQAMMHARPALAFPLWSIAACTGCLVVLAALSCLRSGAWPLPGMWMALVPALNFLLGPIAALIIIRKRRWSYAH